jgi:DNA repair exonuclease SbcCD ATPase subunit
VLARVDELPAAAELEELRTAVAELARRPAADPGLEAALEELRAVVAEHAAQAHDPALAERVDALGERLDDVAGDARGAAERVSRLGELEERLEGLAAELAQHDEGSTRMGELAAAVSDLTGRVEALAAVAGAAVDADAVEALKAALDELAGRTATDPALASRIDALVEHVALLPDGHELQELRGSLDELLQREHVVSELSARIEEVAARLDESPSRDATEVVGAEVRELAGRVEEISRRLDEAAAEVVADLVRAPELAALRDSLDERLGGLDLLAARLDDLTTEIAARDREDERGGRDRAVALERVERLEQAVIELAQQRPENALADRVALLERGGAAADDLERIAGAVEIVRAEVHDRLASMAAELQGLDGRLDGLAARPALEPEAEARVAGVEARLEEVTRSVAAGQASERQVAGSTLTGDAVEDIERLRMSIERLGHTIGEQGRAIAELMKMRGDNDALSRLTARIEALEDGGFAGSGTGDGAPPAGLGTLTRRVDDTDAALEKLLTQLERMGSSLEWRFRRLEEMVGGGG